MQFEISGDAAFLSLDGREFRRISADKLDAFADGLPAAYLVFEREDLLAQKSQGVPIQIAKIEFRSKRPDFLARDEAVRARDGVLGRRVGE